MYDSLKEFVHRLESEGELLRIKSLVSTVYEIAEITDRMAKSTGGGKALLFENTGTDFPVLTNMMGSDRRIAMALGCSSLDQIADRIADMLARATAPKNSLMDKLRMLPLLADMSKWMPRMSSSKGECQQVTFIGNEASLALLPILKCWGCDGGRFITLPMVNTIDPVTGIRNVGMYRMQVFDNRTTGMHWHIHKTGARHYDAYKKVGKIMPLSIALGGDPVYTYAATAPMPDNMDEYLLAGFLRRKPVRLVKCLTNDIYIPSDCDFVIEGYVDPAKDKVEEGAFGDHTGFYSLTDFYPRFHVTAITHRRNAIYPATIVGIPPQEDAYIAKATEKIFLEPIRFALQPEIEDMTMPSAGTAHNLAIVSIDRRYDGQAHKIAQSLWGAGQMMFNKYLLVLPSGVDLRSDDMVAAFLRRVDVERNIMRSEGVLDILDHATATMGFGGKMAIDATNIDPLSSVEPISKPSVFSPVGGVQLANTEYLEKWGAVILFAAQGHSEHIDVAQWLETNSLQGAKYALLFDDCVSDIMTASDLVWLAAANTDPRRDIIRWCGTLIIDARSKRADLAGNPVRFPNVVTSLPETIRIVSERWSEYGLGEFIESPSRRYRKLCLSDKAEW